MLRSFEEIKEALHKGELTLPQLVENYLEQIEKNNIDKASDAEIERMIKKCFAYV